MKTVKNHITFISAMLVGLMTSTASYAVVSRMDVPVNRSELVILSAPAMEVSVASPDIADVYIHGATRISVIGKKIGNTSLRIFDKDNNQLKDIVVYVTYDLPAIRKTLRDFFPNERIGVEVVNENLALVGEVSEPMVAKRAIQVVSEFINNAKELSDKSGGATGDAEGRKVKVLNLTNVRSGQQVMLRVKIAEIQRSILKQIGTGLSVNKIGSSSETIFSSLMNNVQASTGGAFSLGRSLGSLRLQSYLDALEQQGLLKVLAEPNLVAISGEKAEFIAGGEFPVPVLEEGNNGQNRLTVEFRKFGVSVQFTPVVISSNRIRLAVNPEVTEPTDIVADGAGGIPIRGVNTRKVKTTVELAPGESFMIAGLIKDRISSNIEQIPGISEVPILSAMFRKNNYEREETELVIAVTPYLVDPVTGNEIRLPTDNFKPASMLDMMFYGALGAISNETLRVTQTPSLEGPIGFMVD